jgi:hypothetical protein
MGIKDLQHMLMINYTTKMVIMLNLMKSNQVLKVIQNNIIQKQFNFNNSNNNKLPLKILGKIKREN